MTTEGHTRDSKMSEKQPKGEKDEILELIQVIDRYKGHLFKWYDAFLSMIPILFAILVSYAVIEPVLIFGTMSNIERISGALALIAVVVALFALVTPFVKEDVVRINFKRILKLSSIEEDKRPLLKALIKIKAKNREFELEELYKEGKAIFAKEKLLERLCE
jgi:hypothetical protein